MIGIIIAFFSIVLIWGVKNYLIGKTATPALEEQISQAALQVKQVAEIVDIATMYLGSEKLLVHLDIRIDGISNVKDIERIVEKVKEQVKKEVPVAYSIQIETKVGE